MTEPLTADSTRGKTRRYFSCGSQHRDGSLIEPMEAATEPGFCDLSSGEPGTPQSQLTRPVCWGFC